MSMIFLVTCIYFRSEALNNAFKVLFSGLHFTCNSDCFKMEILLNNAFKITHELTKSKKGNSQMMETVMLV